MDSDSYNEAVDCDEDDPMTHPGAVEVCNDNDDDCDGLIDEDFDWTRISTRPRSDCNDTPPPATFGNPPTTGFFINPGGTESYNGVDDNCDGLWTTST